MDAIFRVTESVYLVSLSANNSIDVVKRSYINGTEADHQSNLGAAISAKFSMAKGTPVDEAVNDAKFEFADILSEYDYQRLRKGEDSRNESFTPTGVRCKDNTKGASAVISKVLKKVGVDADEKETLCTNFLGCFECEQHALVAGVDDIWLMLSFKETLQQLQQTPAVNSMPQSQYAKLFNTVAEILDRFKAKSSENFKVATEKLKEATHPLYSNVYSINDLMELSL